MQFHLFGIVAMAALAVSSTAHNANADSALRISGPHVHENLAVYFVHGPSAAGPVPLTLQEGLEKNWLRVSETGDVNELKIENTGPETVFIQSGDIVKGGKQDRVITSSLVLPSKSGEIPLAAFCVEHGRWTSRGTEDVATFASSAEAVPSREAKLAMRAPRETTSTAGADEPDQNSRVYERQADVWKSVAAVQSKLAGRLKAKVAAPESETSLQLSLENAKLQEMRSTYAKALQDAGKKGGDIIGYAFAVNGKLNSAEVYASNGLFLKMWPKQLQSAATEAIGERDGKRESAPSAEAVNAFLADARQGAVREKSLRSANMLEVRDSDRAVYFAASPSAGAVFHESYLAK